tara:strand:+ start:3836 stop:4159 length:324 start_codon:yes stop_codon:yes gene_type:complete
MYQLSKYGVITLILVISFETLAQLYLENSVKQNVYKLTFVGVLFYALVAIAYKEVLSEGIPIYIANSLWSAGSGISLLGVSYFYFHDKVTWSEVLGVILIIIGGLFL